MMHELLAVFSTDDDSAAASSAAVQSAFVPLRRLRPHALAVGSAAAGAAWRGAVAEFDGRLAAVEGRVVAKLKELLGTSLLPTLASATSGASAARPPHGRQPAAPDQQQAAAGKRARSSAQVLQVLSELRAIGALLTRSAVADALVQERRALGKHVRLGGSGGCFD